MQGRRALRLQSAAPGAGRRTIWGAGYFFSQCKFWVEGGKVPGAARLSAEGARRELHPAPSLCSTFQQRHQGTAGAGAGQVATATPCHLPRATFPSRDPSLCLLGRVPGPRASSRPDPGALQSSPRAVPSTSPLAPAPPELSPTQGPPAPAVPPAGDSTRCVQEAAGQGET